MKWHQKHTKLITEIISMLFVLLFVYAAVSKFLIFQDFRGQLSQAPIAGGYANLLVWLIPMIEIGVTIMLLLPKLRLAGIYASLILMVIFSVYIIIVLNLNTNIPCSCGGIISKLSWKEHLIFNLFCIVLLIIAIGTELKKNK